MATKAKATLSPKSAKTAAKTARTVSVPSVAPAQLLPSLLTTEERLIRIAALAERIDGHVKYICGVKGLNGSSAEAKHVAVADFHERMVALERVLNKIQEDLRLG